MFVASGLVAGASSSELAAMRPPAVSVEALGGVATGPAPRHQIAATPARMIAAAARLFGNVHRSAFADELVLDAGAAGAMSAAARRTSTRTPASAWPLAKIYERPPVTPAGRDLRRRSRPRTIWLRTVPAGRSITSPMRRAVMLSSRWSVSTWRYGWGKLRRAPFKQLRSSSRSAAPATSVSVEAVSPSGIGDGRLRPRSRRLRRARLASGSCSR